MATDTTSSPRKADTMITSPRTSPHFCFGTCPCARRVLVGQARRWTQAINVLVVGFLTEDRTTVVVEDVETGRRNVFATSEVATWKTVA